MAIAPAQLEWAWLGRVVFEPDLHATLEDAGKTAYTVEPNVTIGDLHPQEDGSLAATVTLSASISFSRTDDEEGPLPFSLAVDVHGIFRWDASALPPSDPLARGWLEYNGMYLLWPYLRTFIATITGLSHLPGLTIFTMNVPKPPVIPADELSEDETVGGGDEGASEASPSQHADLG